MIYDPLSINLRHHKMLYTFTHIQFSYYSLLQKDYGQLICELIPLYVV